MTTVAGQRTRSLRSAERRNLGLEGGLRALPRVMLALAFLAGGLPPISACSRRLGADHGAEAAFRPKTQCLPSRSASEAPNPTEAMVLIKGGWFSMGALPLRPEEGPERRSRVGDFWIDRTDVTNAAFARFVKATGYVTQAERALDPKLYPDLSGDALKPSAIVFVGSDQPRGTDPSQWWRVVAGADWRHPEGPRSSIKDKDQRPVVQVGYADALAYARWLGHDLPTEAEWEYAAQGGHGPRRFVWGDAPFDDAHPQANVWQGVFPWLDTGADGFKAQTAPVGCFPPNGYGLYDMAGNVWQWTKDLYRANLDPSNRQDPQGPAAEDGSVVGDPNLRRHVIKGGSFLCSPDYCFRYRPTAREAGPDDGGENHIGFRTVLRLAPVEHRRWGQHRLQGPGRRPAT